MNVIGDGTISEKFGYMPRVGQKTEIPEGLRGFIEPYETIQVLDYYDVAAHCCSIHPNVFVMLNENIPYNPTYTHGWGLKNKQVIFQNARHFLAVSQSVYDCLITEGISPDRISVVPFWCAVSEEYRRLDSGTVEGVRNELIWALNRDFIVLYVGRGHSHKGIDVLRKAVSRPLLKDKVGLVLVGTEERSNHDRMEDNVLILGKKNPSELLLLYNAADLLVLPSLITTTWVEQFGRVIVEAMACGTPCVATDFGGPRDIVAHGETGFLIPPDNVYSLEGVISRLVEEPDLLMDMGEDCLVRYRRKFDKDLVDRMINLEYEKYYVEG